MAAGLAVLRLRGRGDAQPRQRYAHQHGAADAQPDAAARRRSARDARERRSPVRAHLHVLGRAAASILAATGGDPIGPVAGCGRRAPHLRGSGCCGRCVQGGVGAGACAPRGRARCARRVTDADELPRGEMGGCPGYEQAGARLSRLSEGGLCLLRQRLGGRATGVCRARPRADRLGGRSRPLYADPHRLARGGGGYHRSIWRFRRNR